MVEEKTYKWIQARLREIDSGALSEKDLARLQDIAREDPFVADALEGFHAHPDAGHTDYLASIEERIKVQKRRRRRWLVPNLAVTAIAACFLILIAGYAVIMRMDNEPSETTFVFVEPDSLFTLDSTAGAIAMESDRALSDQSIKNGFTPPPPAMAKKQVHPDDVFDRTEIATKQRAASAGDDADRPAPHQQTTQRYMDEVPYRIEGVITDAETNTPLAFSPYLVGFSNKLSFTDADGKFKFDSPVRDFVLSVKHKGYLEKTMVLTAGQELIHVHLSSTSEDTIGVLPETKEVESTITLDEQTMAYFEFRNYIAKNARLTLGTGMSKDAHIVTVQFNVNAQGRPHDMLVMQSSGEEKYDLEAIRLIESGPNWICNSRKGNCTQRYTFYFQ